MFGLQKIPLNLDPISPPNSNHVKSSHSSAHGYRPDIDGLRAIAVVLVVIFHAFPLSLPSGFIGVDLFFVISGYLISGIIFTDLRLDRFSFVNFYARRIRRIFPALILILGASYLIGWLWLLPDEYEQLGEHIAGGAGFISNFVLLTEAGYFNSDAELKPLLHLWSLGIEEQFYLIWPLLLYFAWKRRFSPLWPIILLLVSSFSLNVALIHSYPTSVYYLPFTRFWELMVGCALAYLNHFDVDLAWLAPKNPQVLSILRNRLAMLGVAAITGAAFLLNKDLEFPGWWGLLPTFGACLLIAAGPSAWFNRVCLSHPLLVLIGLISFPLYLWHWPLLAFARIVAIDPPTVQLRAVLVLLSVVLAWLTYQFIELPIRSRTSGIEFVPILGAFMLLLLVLGVGTYLDHGIPFRMRDKIDYSTFFGDFNYTKSHNLMYYDRHECNFYDILAHRVKPTIDSSCYTPHSKKVIFLWGDSHVQHLNFGLKASLPADVSLLQVASSGCFPAAVDWDKDTLGTCNRANRFALEKIAITKPDIVILAQSSVHEFNDFANLAIKLKHMGVRSIILIGPVPQWQPDLFKIILKLYWGHIPPRLNTHLRMSVLKTDAIMQQRYRNSRDITYISLIDRLCNSEGCLTYLDGNPKEGLITYDYGHFTLIASRYVAQNIIVPYIQQAMAKPQ